MSIYAYIVAAVLLFATGAGVGVKWEKGQQALRDKEAREQADETRRQQLRGVDTAAVGHEDDKRQIATKYVVITERIEDAKQTDFYAPGAPACLDDDGVRIVNDAARPADAASQPAGTMPRASAPVERRAGNRP